MFRNLKKEKELVDQEVELYRKERKLAVDTETLQYREDIVNHAKKAAQDMAKNEHEYHSKMEGLGIDIAKLETKKELLVERKELWNEQKELMLGSLDSYKELLEAKDDEIERLAELLDKMIENIPEFPEINVDSR
jgi:chromosome segregation ATPase